MKWLRILPLLLMITVNSNAAMTCDIPDLKGNVGDNNIRITNFVCTFNTTPGTASYTLTPSQMGYLNNRMVRHLYTIPGSTGPTINSDLSIIDSRGAILLSVIGNGADVVDNSTTNGPFYMDGTGSNDIIIVHSEYPLTFTVTNNAVNNSSFTLSIESLRY